MSEEKARSGFKFFSSKETKAEKSLNKIYAEIMARSLKEESVSPLEAGYVGLYEDLVGKNKQLFLKCLENHYNLKKEFTDVRTAWGILNNYVAPDMQDALDMPTVPKKNGCLVM